MTDSQRLAAGLTVVVPAYRSAEHLPLLMQRLVPVLRELDTASEVILVCDDGAEDTWASISKLAEHHPNVLGINLMRNYGQHNALLCGIRAARFDTIVTMDDDLQHPPEELPKLLNEIRLGFDVVYGTPDREQHGLTRNLASRLVKMSLGIAMGVREARNASALRAFRTHLRTAFSTQSDSNVSIDVLLSWATTRFSSVQVRHEERPSGASGYTAAKLVSHAINMLTGFSAFPLRIASFIGFAFTIFGALSLAWVLGRYLATGTSVAGFPFLASVVSIFSGAQLACLGIIGEYLARMHFQNIGRPVYAIRNTTDESPRPSPVGQETHSNKTDRGATP